MQKIIKIDVDGVIRDMLGALCKLYYRFDPDIVRENVTNYDVNVSFPMIREKIGIEAYEYFFKRHSEDVNFNMAVPLNGAKEAMEMIRAAGYKIVIVTKQRSHASKIRTIEFLRHYGIYYDDICFTGDKWLVKSDFMVDDNPEFLTDEREKTEHSNRFIIDAPYNRDCHDFERFLSLYDLARYLVRKLIENESKTDNDNRRRD